jgi:KaiC/GvpD/RAD55 family RecA-like ATPase
MITPPLLRTGDWGLDLALGGGVRLVPRLQGTEPSATMLVRGGAGAGKSSLAFQTATSLASTRGGDVAYGCVELLPTELLAQRQWIWGAAGQSEGPPAASALFQQPPFAPDDRPGVHVFASLLDAEDRDAFGASVEELIAAARQAGGNPKVLVIDSVSAGYGLSSPRLFVDAVVKLAAREGLALLVLEEGNVGAQSDWDYAVDIVIELDHIDRTEVGAQLERKLWVLKNRFAPTATGPHRFSIITGQGVRIFPAPVTYATPWAVDALDLPPAAESVDPSQSWKSWNLEQSLAHEMKQEPGWPSFHDGSIFVTGTDAEVVTAVSRTIGAHAHADGVDLWINIGDINPTLRRLPRQKDHWGIGFGNPFLSSQRFMYEVVDALRLLNESNNVVRRVVVGDLAALATSVVPTEVQRALVVLLSLLRREELPVVLFETAPARTQIELDASQQLVFDTRDNPLPALAEHTDAVLELLPHRSKSAMPQYSLRLWHRSTGKRAFAPRVDRDALMRRAYS